jgi:sporulation protein YlmC with PRC-barrel domain
MKKTQNGSLAQSFWNVGLALGAAFIMLIGFAAWSAAAEQDQAGIRASELMDHPVLNSKGEEILEIDDLILRRNGNVKRVVLSCCGFLGLGAKRVAVPFRRLQFKQDEIVYDVTEEEFKQMAEFDYADEELYTGYYSARPGTDLPRTPRRRYPRYYGPYYPRYGAEESAEYCRWQWSHSPGSLLCSAVLGRPVVNNQCQRIGFVDDLFIGLDGQVKEIVLRVLRMDLDKERVSLPYKPFNVTYWGLAYDVMIEELRNMPEFQYQEGQ